MCYLVSPAMGESKYNFLIEHIFYLIVMDTIIPKQPAECAQVYVLKALDVRSIGTTHKLNFLKLNRPKLRNSFCEIPSFQGRSAATGSN